LEDSGSAGGGLTKTGAGRITFSGANTFTGPIDVRAGDLYFSATNGLPDDYAGTVTLTNDAAASIGCAKIGGATQLRDCLNTNSVGYLTLFAANAADTVDFSTFPYMKLAFSGAFDYTGTFIPYQGVYTFQIEGSTVTNNAVLTDAGTTPGHLSITGVSGGGMVLNGDSSFTGGVEIDAATVTLGHANAFGYQAIPGMPDIELRNGAVLRFVADMDINALVTGRLTTASSGILLVGAANAAKNIDLRNHPGIVVGSAEYTLNYTGNLTPSTALEAYTLGGGNAVYSGQSYHGFSVSNLTDGATVNKVIVGTPGIVELKAGNTYSGGTVVNNRGVLFLASDGLGAVPETAEPNNLYVDNGVIRSGPTEFTLHQNRGVTVGPKGMELHPWGSYTMTVAGNLSGAGTITMTDGGYVTFAGADNTYNGKVTLSSGNFRIGDGANFTWGSTGGITDNATLRLKTDAEKSFGDAVSGGGAVRKEGTGALTLTVPESYSGATYIDAGTLRVSSEGVLPQGSGKGAVEIASGAFLETDGMNLRVGVAEARGGTLECWGENAITDTLTLAGGTLKVTYGTTGLIGKYVWLTRPGGTQQELPNALLFTGLDTGETRIGTLAGDSGNIAFADTGLATLRILDAADMTYGGTISGSNIASRLVKESAGTLTLSASGSDYYGELDIKNGDLVLTNGASTLGLLNLAAGTSAKAYGQNGLQMYFYNRSTSDSDYSEFQSMAAWGSYLSTAFPSGPNYVTNSLMLGANLDTGSAGTAWPTPYVQTGGAEADTYDAYLFGSIFLSQSGTYTFGTGSDDGSMLFIDRQLVVNNGYNQGVTQRSGTIALTAGFHAIDILYRENTGGNALQVYIAYPGGSLTLMPQSILFGGAALHGLSGDVYVTSTNSFAGTVVINSGRLVFGPGATLGPVSVVTNTATVEVETSGSINSAQIVGDLVGGGDVEVTGTGTLVMNDSMVYTGTTRVHTGATLQVSKPVNLGGGGDVALEGGTLAIKPDVEAGTNQLASALDSGTWTLNGCAIWTNRSGSQWVRLTPNLARQAGSAFYNTKITPHVPWYASFRYEVGAHPVGAADGATFLLQNSSLTALGASGGALGASGVTPSIGVFLNIYQTPTVGWIVNGSRVDAVSALNGIVLTNGVDVSVSYNGTDLKVTVEQDGKVYTATRTVNLYTTFSGDTAYIGFTGGTGGATAEQFVGNFEMTDAVPTSTDFDNDITVAAGGMATVNVAANGSGTGVLALDTLTIGSGSKLVVTGAVSTSAIAVCNKPRMHRDSVFRISSFLTHKPVRGFNCGESTYSALHLRPSVAQYQNPHEERNEGELDTDHLRDGFLRACRRLIFRRRAARRVARRSACRRCLRRQRTTLSDRCRREAPDRFIAAGARFRPQRGVRTHGGDRDVRDLGLRRVLGQPVREAPRGEGPLEPDPRMSVGKRSGGPAVRGHRPRLRRRRGLPV